MILCLVEPGELSLEALTFAQGLGPVQAFSIDAGEAYAPGAWAAAIVQLVEKHSPDAVVAAASDRGQEVMAHVAARLDLPLAANCVSAQPGEQPGDPWQVVRQRWGGSLLEEATLSGAVKLLTVAQHVVEAAAPVPVEPFAPELSEADLAVRVVRREEPPPGTVSLTDARVVVGGGRGVGSAEGFGAPRGARGAARRCGRRLARGHEPRLAGARRPGRPDRRADRPRPLHRLRDQRRDPAHRRLQGREEDPRDQQGPARPDRHPRRTTRSSATCTRSSRP